MYILDSNILIGHLSGDASIKEWIKNHLESEYLAISTISKIETLCFPELKGNDLYEAEKFIDLFGEVSLLGNVASVAIKLKRNTDLSLADSIIAATAISKQAILVTNDKTLAKKIKKFVEVLSLG
jgi:predicted nucleic acid-binding protein